MAQSKKSSYCSLHNRNMLPQAFEKLTVFVNENEKRLEYFNPRKVHIKEFTFPFYCEIMWALLPSLHCFKHDSPEFINIMKNHYNKMSEQKRLEHIKKIHVVELFNGIKGHYCHETQTEYHKDDEKLFKTRFKKSFVLDAYLDALPDGYSPSNAEWNQIMQFLAHHFEADKYQEVANKLNDKFRPQNLNENINYLRNYQHAECTVTEGSLRRILRKYSTEDYVVQDIFPDTSNATKKITYYSEFKKFARGVHDAQEVYAFAARCTQYISSSKQFITFYKKVLLDRNGIQHNSTIVDLSKNIPFGGTDNVAILIKPRHLQELKEQMGEKRVKDPTVHKILSKEQCLQTTLEEIHDMFGTYFPLKIKLGDVMKTMMLDYDINRYDILTFEPYLDKKTTRIQNGWNVFRGFALNHYVPKTCIDIKNTTVYTYFVNVWGDGDPDCKILDDLLNRIAHMIQKPQIRMKKMIILRSKLHGLGKSLLFMLLECVMGDDVCMFHTNLDTYLDKFNIQNAFKLVHFTDDIQANSRRDSRKLFSLCTTDKKSYQKKNETPIIVPEYSNLFITSNDVSPLFTEKEDRRQIMYEASSKMHKKYAFFTKFVEELNDIEVAKAWFDFFKHKDLTNFNFQQPPPNMQKEASIWNSAPKSHRFIMEIFQDNDWVPEYHGGKPRFSVMKKSNESFLRIHSKDCYLLYKDWMKSSYGASNTRGDSQFRTELEELGIKRSDKPQKINLTTTAICFEIRQKHIQKVFQKIYPTVKWIKWTFEDLQNTE